MRRAKPGTKGKLSAEAFNTFAAAAERVKLDSGQSGGGGLGFTPQSSIVRMKNLSGSAVPRWGMLQPFQPLVLPSTNEQSFLQQVLIAGSNPSKDKPAFMALEAVPNNAIGDFLAPGHVVPVKIFKADDITYRVARPTNSNSGRLQAIETDEIEENNRLFEILWHETGEGEKWALILMPGILRASATVIGPCGAYSPAAELDDSEFDIEFDGCLWPSRFGIAYNNIASGGSSTWRNLELDSVGGGSIVYSSNTYSHSCFTGSVDVHAVATFSSRAVNAGVIQFVKTSDSSLQAEAINTIYRFNPSKGGHLQFQSSVCNCATWPQEVCLSPPTR